MHQERQARGYLHRLLSIPLLAVKAPEALERGAKFPNSPIPGSPTDWPGRLWAQKGIIDCLD